MSFAGPYRDLMIAGATSHSSGGPGMIHRFEQFELDEEKRRLCDAAGEIALQPLVFDLLATLVRHHARVVSKDELFEILWPDVHVTEASLQRAVSVARSKLGDGDHRLIRTFTGYGYRFCAPVRSVPGAAEPIADASPAVGPAAPPLRYVETADGIGIAYWTLGNGPPLVYVPNLIWSHARLEWEVPAIRRWYQKLADRYTVVRFDPRGTGCSQRDLDRYYVRAVQADLAAVVDRLRLDRFSLVGDLNGAMVALRAAAELPEQVESVVLWHAFAAGEETEGPKWRMMQSLQPLMHSDWETYTETRAHMGAGWEDGDSAHRYAALLRQCTDPVAARRIYEALREEDVRPLLPAVAAPSLVLHRRDFRFWDLRVSRELTSRLTDARLVVLDGAGSAPFLGDAESVLDAIEAFDLERRARDAAGEPTGGPPSRAGGD